MASIEARNRLVCRGGRGRRMVLALEEGRRQFWRPGKDGKG
jgi:hypothetical protein